MRTILKIAIVLALSSCGFTHKTIESHVYQNDIEIYLAQKKVFYLNSFDQTTKQYSNPFKLKIDSLNHDSIYGVISIAPVSFHEPHKKRFRYAYYYEVNGKQVVRDSLIDPLDVMHITLANKALLVGNIGFARSDIVYLSRHKIIDKEVRQSVILFSTASAILVAMLIYVFNSGSF